MGQECFYRENRQDRAEEEMKFTFGGVELLDKFNQM